MISQMPDRDGQFERGDDVKGGGVKPGKRRAKSLEELDRLAAIALPALGDSSKIYPVMLTEPEIKTIYAARGYIHQNCLEIAAATPHLKQIAMKFWDHYGPTLKTLSDRLAQFDDEPAEGKPN